MNTTTHINQRRKAYCLSLRPDIAKAAAVIAADRDMSLSRLVERLLKREAKKTGEAL